METSYLKTLELDKIIARAAEGCVCKEARAMLLAIEPQCDPDEVRYALEQTDAINTLLIKNGSPRFGGVEGVSQLAARAVKGGVLSMGELLMVAGALRNFQHLTSWYGSSEHDALPTARWQNCARRSAPLKTASATGWKAWCATWIPQNTCRRAWFPCATAGMLCRSRASTAAR